jgi:hypothetical protein
MGELGYLLPRFNEINKTITALDGVAVASGSVWSSSEYSSCLAYYLSTSNGRVSDDYKSNGYCVRPFSIL